MISASGRIDRKDDPAQGGDPAGGAGATSASAAEPQTCRDERTGVVRAVTVRLTERADTYAARPGDVIAALGGIDADNEVSVEFEG